MMSVEVVVEERDAELRLRITDHQSGNLTPANPERQASQAALTRFGISTEYSTEY